VRAHGFSVIEAVIASAILITGLASLAQLFVASTRATGAAGMRSMAAILAVDKMEQLRVLAWTVDHAGLSVSDSGLSASPPDALDRDVAGFSDRPNGWTRRWSVQPLPANPGDTIVVQVRVITPGGEEARMTTVRTRRAN
jgi:hypothetical protein